MKVKSENEVTQLCPTLSDPMDWRPTRLLRLWDFPGKSTGVGCHCLLWKQVLVAVKFSCIYILLVGKGIKDGIPVNSLWNAKFFLSFTVPSSSENETDICSHIRIQVFHPISLVQSLILKESKKTELLGHTDNFI